MNDKSISEQSLLDSPLGDHTRYVNKYDASLLFPIERTANWRDQGVNRNTLPFINDSCVDIWNGYEISWLNRQGKPIVRVAQFTISAQSKYIIESKSFKLYLNSFNLTEFESQEQVIERMEADLSAASEGEGKVALYHLDDVAEIAKLPGECIDECELTVKDYSPNASLLQVNDTEQVQTSVYSHLLKSNCPVTGQPDWASISIEYSGAKIEPESLLAYLISYREHGDFHEQCVETIFMDIWQQCKPLELSVYARYVRRGGLDINPYRSSLEKRPENLRLSRQ